MAPKWQWRRGRAGEFSRIFSPEKDLEPIFVLAMREIRLLRRATRQSGAAAYRLIEGGPEVVEGVGSAEPHLAGSWWKGRESQLQFPRLNISLGDTSYHVSIREGFEGHAVIGDVALGPFNL